MFQTVFRLIYTMETFLNIELMMKHIAEGATRIFLACGYTDFLNESGWLLLSLLVLNRIRIMETMFLSFATEKEIP